MKVAINQIIPDPNQPRKTFNPETLSELKDSLNGLGLIQPITVRPYQDNKYMIIVGERRFKAAKQRGDNKIECIIREDVDDKTATEMQFAENSQQEDVPPIELGKAFYEHRQQYGMTQRELAQVIGLSHLTIERHESLYNRLLPKVTRLLKEGKLGKRLAYEVSTIKDASMQEAVGQLIANSQLPQETAIKVIATTKAQPQKLDEVRRIVAELPKNRRDKALDNILSEINHQTIEQTQSVIASIEPEIKMETPDDLRKAAQTLYKEAKRKAQETITPKEKAEAEAKKIQAKAEREAKAKARQEQYAEMPKEDIEALVEVVNKKHPDIAERFKPTNKKKLHTPKVTPPLPEGIFNVIYADPPWQYDNTGVDGAASHHYQTISIQELCTFKVNGIPIQDKFAENAVLFMWVTNPFLRDAFTVLDAWGFNYKTNIVWVKQNLKKPGAGFYVRGRHELLFICTKGSFTPDMSGKEPIGSILFADVQEHSKKPKEVYSLIKNIYPNCKYLELFAREQMEGWTVWGNELQIKGK